MKSKIPKHMKEANPNAIVSGASDCSEKQVSDFHRYVIMVRPVAGPLLVVPRQVLQPIEDDLKVTIG